MVAVLLEDSVQGADSLVVVHADGANLAGDRFDRAVGDGLHRQTVGLADGAREREVWAEWAGERLGAWRGMTDGRQVERHREGNQGAEVVASAGVEGIGSGVESGQVGSRQADGDAACGGLGGIGGRQNVRQTCRRRLVRAAGLRSGRHGSRRLGLQNVGHLGCAGANV